MPFTHLDRDGNAHMVDVGDKSASRREAVASARVSFPPDVYAALRESGGETRKGSITATAQIAGIMAAKQTANLIPLCHPLPLAKCTLDFALEQTPRHAVCATATVKVTGETGVEMEALHAVSVALLTIYDMCKAIDKRMEIGDIHLERKSGGKSGTFVR